MMQKSGSREELVDELREMSEGWHHLCKDELSQRASEAAQSLEAGSCSVKVGHTTYSVLVETSDGEATER